MIDLCAWSSCVSRADATFGRDRVKIKKGGGRESGVSGENSAPKAQVGDDRGPTVQAAANPAAFTPIQAFRRDGFCSPEHFKVLDEAIRALEAEIMDQAKLIEDNQALEAELAAATPAVHPGLVGDWDCRNCLLPAKKRWTLHEHLENAHRRIRALEAEVAFERGESDRVVHRLEEIVKERDEWKEAALLFQHERDALKADLDRMEKRAKAFGDGIAAFESLTGFDLENGARHLKDLEAEVERLRAEPLRRTYDGASSRVCPAGGRHEVIEVFIKVLMPPSAGGGSRGFHMFPARICRKCYLSDTWIDESQDDDSIAPAESVPPNERTSGMG